MQEVSDSPEEGWEKPYADRGEDLPLPTVHHRVMLTDLPPSGLADIARRLKLTLPEAEFVPEQPAVPGRTALARRGPVLADLPATELDELARALFARVVDGPTEAWTEVPSTEELFAYLRRELGDDQRRIDAFVYRVEGGRPVVVVRPSTAREGTRTLRRIVRATSRDVAWKVVDLWIGVPISMVLNPPADLAEAVYYAADLGR
ncbi:hypothetical protein AB0J74_04110 [Asanoa sp. NPDC049573]|uniref:hypothetical protein n=1 Tax=Asanoa sp. NPDC049573 TaxID=3155396 RepID=UPI00344A2783